MNGEGIYVMDADGGNVRMLTTMGNFTWAHPVWSPVPAPDGRYKVAYIDKVATDVRAVFCVNTDGTGPSTADRTCRGTNGALERELVARCDEDRRRGGHDRRPPAPTGA